MRMEQQNYCIFKEGWLQKRGEHIKTWRPRYFILRNDGYFNGYNSKPNNNEDVLTPNNSFFIKDCKILTSDKPKNNVFIIRCLGGGKNITVERVFAATTNQEREEWITAIQNVSGLLNGCFVVDISGKPGNKITLHDFEFLKILGKGTFGKVILCRERNTKRICAMKILKKSLIVAKNEVQHTETENKVLRSIKHPFITSLIYSFQTSDRLCLVMEYVNGGELFFHLSREKRFSEDRARFYTAEICLAIGFLHENNIVYRDIKLENVLLDNEGHIKLADFGLCKMNMPYEQTTDTFCGTPEYLAPEILTESNGTGYGRAVDWWSVGVLLYEMLIGRLPFSNSDVKLLFHKIINENADIPLFLSSQSKLILNQLLEKNPNKRLGASRLDFKELQMHSFFMNIDWNLLLQKKLEPPFKPLVSSEIDTRYFEKEFTGENVQLTPTTSEDIDFNDYMNLSNYGNNLRTNNLKYFDSFSYYGSKTSLIQNYRSNTSLDDKNDINSIASSTNDHYKSELSLNENNLIDEFHHHHQQQQQQQQTILKFDKTLNQNSNSNNSSSIMSDNFFYPYLVQYTDNTGQLYESQTYAASQNNVLDTQNILRLNNNEQLQNFHIFNHTLFANLTNPFLNNLTNTNNNFNHNNIINMVIDEQNEN